MAEETIRVLLAEDIEILRRGLRALLAAYPEVEIAGEASDGIEAVRLVAELEPQVVLMDLSMPRMTGVDAIAEIKRLHPKTRVLALTAYTEADLVSRTLLAGADGYLLKNVAAEELATAIRRAAEGRLYLSPEVGKLLIESCITRGEAGACEKDGLLSDREWEVLGYILAGQTGLEIASRLDLGSETVEARIKSLKHKLGARSSAELLVDVIERGMAEADCPAPLSSDKIP